MEEFETAYIMCMLTFHLYICKILQLFNIVVNCNKNQHTSGVNLQLLLLCCMVVQDCQLYTLQLLPFADIFFCNHCTINFTANKVKVGYNLRVPGSFKILSIDHFQQKGLRDQRMLQEHSNIIFFLPCIKIESCIVGNLHCANPACKV